MCGQDVAERKRPPCLLFRESVNLTTAPHAMELRRPLLRGSTWRVADLVSAANAQQELIIGNVICRQRQAFKSRFHYWGERIHSLRENDSLM